MAQDIVVHSSGLGLAAFRIGVAVSSDHGQTWKMHSRSGDVQGVAISSDGLGCVVYADGTLLITRDRGGSWDEMSLGLAGEVQRACFDQSGRCYILFRHIVPDPNISDEMFEAQRRTSRRAELFRSDDHCRSWFTDYSVRDARDPTMNTYQERVALLIAGLELRHRAHPEDSWEAVSLPDAEDIYLLSHRIWLCPTGYKFLRTIDAGANWSIVSPGLNLIGGTCFVSESRGFTTSGNFGGTFSVAETTDAAQTWNLVHAYDQLQWRFSP